MKRQIIAVLTAGMLLLTGCAASGASQETTEETKIVYRSLPLPNLLVSIPESYAETSSEFYQKYYIRDDASIIITEDTEAANSDIKDYSASALLQYQKTAQRVEDVTGDLIYAGTLAVQTLEFTYYLEEDSAPMTCMVGFCSDNQSVYIITCKCKSENYAENRPDFLDVLRSVSIDKTGTAVAQTDVPSETQLP